MKDQESLEIRWKELPTKPSVEHLLSKLQEPSDTDTTNYTGSSEDDIPSGYMIPMLQSSSSQTGRTSFNLTGAREQ